MTNLMSFLWVAMGGAIGASARYGVSLMLESSVGRFPFATLTVNILGSFLLGLLFAINQHHSVADHWRLFIGVGVLGAFTTFSTFSVEVVSLMHQGETLKAAAHAGLNIILCLVAVVAAMALYNNFLNISVK